MLHWLDCLLFTRKFNWLNLLIHCLLGSNSNTGFQTSLYYCRIMADFQLCCVRTHCSFLSSKKIQTTSQKLATPETSLTFKGDGWFCFSPMGMSFAYFIIEGTFFVTEKSCYGAVYQVLMMHDLDLLLVLLIDLLQSSFYRSSSCSRSFLLLLLLLNTHKSTFWQ